MAISSSTIECLPGDTLVMKGYLARAHLAKMAAAGGVVGLGAASAFDAWEQHILGGEPHDALDIVIQIAVAYERFRPERPEDFDVEGFLAVYRHISEAAIAFLTV